MISFLEDVKNIGIAFQISVKTIDKMGGEDMDNFLKHQKLD